MSNYRICISEVCAYKIFRLGSSSRRTLQYKLAPLDSGVVRGSSEDG